MTYKDNTNSTIVSRHIIVLALFMVLVFLSMYVVNYILNVVLSQWLGVEVYGDFAAAKSTVFFCSSLILLGQDLSLFRFLPSYLSQGDWPHMRGYLWHGGRLITIVGVIVIVISAIVNILLIPTLHDGKTLTGLWGYVYYHPAFFAVWLIPLYGFNVYFSKLLRNLNHGMLATFLLQLLLPLMFLMAILVMKYNQITINIYQIFYIFGVVLFFLLLLQLVLAFKEIPKAVWRSQPVYERGHWYKVAFQLMANNVLALLLFSTSIILLEIFGGNEKNVGIFAAILTIINIYYVLAQATSQVFAPLIRPALETKNHQRIWSLLKISVGIGTVITILLSIFMFLFKQTLLSHFGEVFREGELVFIIMIIGCIINVPFYAVWTFLQYSDARERLLRYMIYLSVFYLLSSILLIHYYDALGAALGILITYVVYVIMNIILSFKMFYVPMCRAKKLAANHSPDSL